MVSSFSEKCFDSFFHIRSCLGADIRHEYRQYDYNTRYI